MSETFATAALGHAATAAQMLGWRPHEFWTATPAEFATALTPPTATHSGIDRAQLEHLLESDDGQHA